VHLFQFPTVRALSAALGSGRAKVMVPTGNGATGNADRAEQRAQARKDAMDRRHDQRRGSRPQRSD
jgi:hypothetical protein